MNYLPEDQTWETEEEKDREAQKEAHAERYSSRITRLHWASKNLKRLDGILMPHGKGILFGLKGCHTPSGPPGDPEGAGGMGSDEVEVMGLYIHQGVRKVLNLTL